jgi:hypothetical protein
VTVFDHLQEPELEFGGGGRHLDIRFGLTAYGPRDVDSTGTRKRIHLGVVGTNDNVEGLMTWLSSCAQGVQAKRSRQPNLFPMFPGFQQAFQSELVMGPELCRTIGSSIVDRAIGLDHDSSVQAAVDLFLTECVALKEKRSLDAIICAVPPQIAALQDPAARGGPRLDFHDMLKARAMAIGVPVQLVLQQTYDPQVRKAQRARSTRLRTQQDEATRAWNFFTALYYKAGGTPWKLPKASGQLATCYIGISFFRTLDRTRLLSSMAQVFNELGDGVIVRGDPVRLSKDDRIPHLDGPSASKLVTHALRRFVDEHQHPPARIVVHKTSAFNAEEIAGIEQGARRQGVSHIDAVSISAATPIRLFRVGAYPPLRGTMLQLDAKSHLLYLKGSVDFFHTYPGGYIPRPLLFRCDRTEQTPRVLATELLALSKMNWNDTQFDGGMPITIGAADRVANILRYVRDGDVMVHRYSYYM